MRGNGCGCVLPDRKTRSDHRYQLSRRYPSVIRNVIHRWVPLDSRDDAVSFPFLYSPFRLLFSPATGETRLHFEEFRVDRARAIYPRSSNTLLRPSGTRKSKGNQSSSLPFLAVFFGLLRWLYLLFRLFLLIPPIVAFYCKRSDSCLVNMGQVYASLTNDFLRPEIIDTVLDALYFLRIDNEFSFVTIYFNQASFYGYKKL